MPVRCSIKQDLLRVELIDECPPDDVIREFVTTIDDPSCPPTVKLLVDVTRSVSLATRSTEEIRRVAEALAPYTERVGGRCAVVAQSDVHFGLSRLGSVYSESVGVKVEVFRDVGEAMEWLGVKRSK
jgi:hypothetical protein